LVKEDPVPVIMDDSHDHEPRAMPVGRNAGVPLQD